VQSEEKVIREQTDLLATLGKCSKIQVIENEQTVPKGCGVSNWGTTKIFLDLGTHINFEKELERLTKKLAEVEGFKENVLKSINDPNRHKAPEKLRQEQDKKLENFLKEEAIINEAIAKIKALQ
jgi:valyl-tRNA synthetase